MSKIGSKIGPSIILFIFTVAFLVLVGWVVDSQTLTRVFPQFTPMNPMTAISFMLIAVCLYLERRKESTIMRVFNGVTAFFLIVLGGCMLIKYSGGPDLNIDRLLFVTKLGVNRMAPTTGLNFFLFGVFLLVPNRLRLLKQILITVILSVSVYALLAYLYNFVGVYGQTIYNPMAIHTATLFMFACLYIWMRRSDWSGQVTNHLRRRGMLVTMIACTVFVVSITIVGAVWYLLNDNVHKQSVFRFESQSSEISTFIQSRMNLYTSTVYGLQGLFVALNNVDKSAWQKYITTLDVPNNLPGVSGITFAERVAHKDVKAFPYAIYPFAQKDNYYPTTYVTSFTVNATTTPLGFDYTSDPGRNQTLEEAIQINKPVATPVIFGVTTHVPLFSVYAPIYDNTLPHETETERQEAARGIVSVSFRLEKIFPDLMQNPLFDQNIDVLIYDAANQSDVASSTLLGSTKNGYEETDSSSIVRTMQIPVANRIWTIKYLSSKNENLPAVERRAPTAVLIVGLMFSLFISVVTAFYIRSREQMLAGKNIQLETLVHNFPYGLFIEDKNRKLILANQQIADLFHLGRIEDHLGKSIGELAERVRPIITTNYEAFLGGIQKILKEGKIVVDEKVQLSGDSYLARSYIPLNYENEYHGAVWIYKDITEEEKISQMKSDFVSLVSHQLKTPVAQIKGYVENMLDGLTGKTNKKQNEYLTDMLHVANKNSKLIDDLLNISRIERGILKVESEKLDVNELLEDVLGPLRNVAKNKGVKLIENSLKKSVSIMGDGVKAREALRNIVDNAIKFTEPTKTVSVSVASNKQDVQITITDQGTGVDPDVQKELFEKNRVWSGKVRASGAGLGLFLSKQFIELMNGTISFTTEIGKGTTFVITFKKI